MHLHRVPLTFACICHLVQHFCLTVHQAVLAWEGIPSGVANSSLFLAAEQFGITLWRSGSMGTANCD